MTAEDFDRLSARITRWRDPARAMARLILVDGVSPADAAQRHNRSRQCAYAAVYRIQAELRRESGAPAGWSAVTVVVPPGAQAEVRQIEARERKRAGL